jgi:phosphate-selective porin OprO/OprP
LKIRNLVALAVLILGLGTSARAVDFDASPDSGLRLSFPSLDSSIRLGGRFFLDYAHFDEDQTDLEDKLDVRQARLYLDGRAGDDWRAKVEYEFSNALEAGFRNVWLEYDGISRTLLRAGNFTMPYGLEELTSSNQLIFGERSLASALAPSYGTGAVAATRGKLFGRSRWLLSGGGFIESFARDSYDRHDSDHTSFTGRGVFDPYVRKHRVVHLGGSINYSDIRGDDTWRVSKRPGTALAPKLLDITLSNVDTVTSFGAEAAILFGPLLVQGEYLQSDVERESDSTLDDPTFTGGYVQGSFVLTGESHKYSRKTATFGGLKPRSKWGAVELAARWGSLDLTNSGVRGGKATDLTFGVNWYLRSNMRLLFNYVRVNSELSGTLEDDDPQIYLFRFMYFL